VGVSKHLPWGTDLSLSIQAGWDIQRSALAAANPSLSSGPGYSTMARFAVSQPLLRGFGRDVNEAGLQQATAQQTASEAARDSTANDLLRDVLTAYWELWYAQAALDIERQSLELATEQRDEAASRQRSGGLAPADLLTFETTVASQQEALLSAEVEVANRAVALAELLGREPYGVGRALDQPPVPEPPAAGLREAAERTSLAIRESELSVAQARVAARTATDSTRPRLDLEAYLQAQGLGNRDLTPMFAELGTLGAVSAHVGMTYELPLDGTQQRAAAGRARLSVEQALTRLEQTRQGVRASVATMLRREEAGRRKLELSAVTVKAAEGQLDAATGRLATGSGTALAIQQAEQDLRNARLRAIRGRIDLLEASIELDHLAGRLLHRHGVRVGEPGSLAR
jgi:outer membrane protein TolC